MASRRRRTPDSNPAPLRATRTVPQLSLVPGRALRWAKIRNVRARIAAGYYDREDVRSRLADAVLRLMRRP